jgi:hypothetical protein
MVVEVLNCRPNLPEQPAGVIIEGQQLYPDRFLSSRELVAKGNDLIALATISGAALTHWAQLPVAKARILLPAEWKGQREKDAMHRHLMRILGGVEIEGPNNNHTRDALCMAVVAAGMWA